MRAHLEYLGYVLRHKWFVFVESCRLGIPWRGFIHDLSKFLPDEWFPYTRFFYGRHARPRRDATGYYKPTDTGDPAFDLAWLAHQHRNSHHWQHWALAEDEGGVKVIEMPEAVRREMLADWRGAGRAQNTPDSARWYQAHKDQMRLGPETRAWVEGQLGKGV